MVVVVDETHLSVFHSVSNREKKLEKQYLFSGSYKLSFFFFLSKSKRLDDIHVT